MSEVINKTQFKMKKNYITLSALLLMLVSNLFSQSDSIYFGQTPPQDGAIIFAPDLISKIGEYEHDIYFFCK